MVDTDRSTRPLEGVYGIVRALTRARERIANKAFIRATNYPSEPFDRGLANARAKGWQVYKVACGHDVMLDEPERLAAILRDRASLHP